jgi:hypothetical protein
LIPSLDFSDFSPGPEQKPDFIPIILPPSEGRFGISDVKIVKHTFIKAKLSVY